MASSKEIMNRAVNANDATEIAERDEQLIDVDQDWENEATLYTFSDESVLVVSGSQVNAFFSMESAREELNK